MPEINLKETISEVLTYFIMINNTKKQPNKLYLSENNVG